MASFGSLLKVAAILIPFSSCTKLLCCPATARAASARSRCADADPAQRCPRGGTEKASGCQRTGLTSSGTRGALPQSNSSCSMLLLDTSGLTVDGNFLEGN